ncbi:putative integral membrane protein, partial [Arthrobacter sp. DR-2P]
CSRWIRNACGVRRKLPWRPGLCGLQASVRCPASILSRIPPDASRCCSRDGAPGSRGSTSPRRAPRPCLPRSHALPWHSRPAGPGRWWAQPPSPLPRGRPCLFPSWPCVPPTRSALRRAGSRGGRSSAMRGCMCWPSAHCPAPWRACRTGKRKRPPSAWRRWGPGRSWQKPGTSRRLCSMSPSSLPRQVSCAGKRPCLPAWEAGP